MRFYLLKLGCPKNDVDGDYLTGRLLADGHTLVRRPDDAEVMIVNTCAFIEEAKEESIDRLLELGLYREHDPDRKLFVTGCMAQRYADELRREIPEIDGIFGLGEWEAIASAMSTDRGIPTTRITESRLLTFKAGEHRYVDDQNGYEYLKISDGCDRQCSYCVIPSVRGRFRSRPVDELVREARYLAERGKQELILVSQDTTLYGCDLKDGANLVGLLKALDEIQGIEWIRVMYLHPAQVNRELIEYMADDGNKVLAYFDLPLQHVDSEILKAMKRPYSEEKIRRLISDIRKADPSATIRSTFIVGFPGESEEQFERLLEFVEEMELDRVAGFAYSQEEGTPAGGLPDQIDEATKAQRLDQLMITQQDIAFDKNESLIGTELEVMLDRWTDEDTAVGHSRGDCPDIDQLVLVRSPGLELGRIARVEVVASEGYDLIGEVTQD